jgi:hypothetical protein
MSDKNTELDLSDFETEVTDFLTSYRKELDERVARANENKEKILGKLKELGVTQVLVNYQGSGDSGDFENAEISEDDIKKGIAKDVLSLNTINILVSESAFKDGKWETTQHEKDVPLSVAIQDMTYDLLESRHPGWEINEGSDGEFLIDVEEGTVKLYHTNYYTQSESYEDEF